MESYNITEADKELLLQRALQYAVKLDVYDDNGQLVETIEGTMQEGSCTVDATADVRRVISLSITPTVLTESITKFDQEGSIWFDKRVHVQIGIWDWHINDYIYYSVGHYVYMTVEHTYDPQTNTFTLSMSDYGAMLDGTRNGQIGALTTTIPAYEEAQWYSTLCELSEGVYNVTLGNFEEFLVDDTIGVQIDQTNPANPTMKINELDAVPLYQNKTTTPLEAGTLEAGEVYVFTVHREYDISTQTSTVYLWLTPTADNDLIIKFNPIKNVMRSVVMQLGRIPKAYIEDIGEMKGLPRFNEDWEQYRANNPTWDSVPYDLDFSAGDSVLSIITTLRDLYPNYESFFEPIDNIFVCQLIPSGEDDNAIMDNSYIQKILMSEQTTVDLSLVRNICEVWGQTIDADWFTEQCEYDSSTSVYSVIVDAYDEYKTSDLVAVRIDTANGLEPKLNINAIGDLPIYKDGTEEYISEGTLSPDTVYVFKVKKSRDTEAKEDIYWCYYLGHYQVHAMDVLTDGTISDEYYMIPSVDDNGNVIFDEDGDIVYEYAEDDEGNYIHKYSQLYFEKVYGCESVNMTIIPDSPFTVQRIGEILDVKSGDEFESIPSDSLALERAIYENWKNCRITDNITITTLLCPFIDVNKKVTYQPSTSDEELPYMTQSIVHDFGALTTQITMYRFYPLTEED